MIRRPNVFCVLLVLCSSLACVSGCSLVGAGLYSAGAEPDIPAKYTPKQEPMLVLVENTGGDESSMDADHLQMALAKSLTDNKVAPLIDFQKLEILKDNNPTGFNKMPIDQIGRAVGAKQVLYVNLTKAAIDNPNGGATIDGEMVAKVIVVDTETGKTRWPVDQHDGEIVNAHIPLKQNTGLPDELKMRRDLGDKMADQISKLFHPYEENEEKLTPDI